MTGTVRVLMIDNRDSFVHTLVDYLDALGAIIDLVQADEVSPGGAAALLVGYDGVVISPGPGTPERAGASMEIVTAAAAARMPLLGVCLGHQAIAAAFGGLIEGALELMHGMTSPVLHDASDLFAGIPSPFVAGRYHSLAVRDASLPPELIVSARTPEGTVMAMRHTTLPITAVQFHPESVLTEHGYRLLGNWLAMIGVTDAADRGARMSPHRGVLSPRTP